MITYKYYTGTIIFYALLYKSMDGCPKYKIYFENGDLAVTASNKVIGYLICPLMVINKLKLEFKCHYSDKGTLILDEILKGVMGI